MTLYDFMHAHWFITWCALWLGWAVAAIVHMILRAILVAIRGWPPQHLDADGDFKPQKEKEDE